MKRILSLLIVGVLIAAVVPSAFASDNLQEKITMVSSLGIMQGYQDGSFREDNLITRAELTAVAIRLSGQGENVVQGLYDARFSDVSANHWAAGYIAAAGNMGIINGYEDGRFQPDNPVTYNEAIKIIVCVLGYGLQAEKLGGYPSGYLAVATQQKMMDFLYYNGSSPINRGEVVRLIYKALDVEIMITQTVGTNGSCTIGKGGTVLETLFNTQTKTGIVTSTSVDSIRGRDIADGYVEIDDVVYKTELDCSGFLGEKVEYALKNNNSESMVVYIKPDISVRRISIINEDIVDVGGLFTSEGKIRYWGTNKNVRTASFVATLNIIYNNKVLPYEQAGFIDFNSDPDLYECTDNDNDGKYDLLKLKEYDDNYVKKVYSDAEKLMLVTDEGALITYDEEDEDFSITSVFDGEIIPFAQICEGDIVSVGKSLDSTTYEIIVSRNSFEGTVTGRSEEDGKITLTVNGNDYKVSDTLKDKQRVPALNDEGRFYLSYDGKISYFEGTDIADGIYGFLTDIEVKKGLGSECSIKILETNNTFSIYTLADKVKFSNKGTVYTKTAKEIATAFDRTPTFDDARQAHTQIIRYKLNKDGEVNYIATAKTTPDTQSFSVATDDTSESKQRFYSNSLFDQRWKVTNETAVFYIPSTKEGEDYTRYRAGAASKYFKSGNTYQVLLYDADENGEIGAIYYNLTGQPREQVFSIDYASSKIMTIDKVVYKNDEEGNTRCSVSGIVNNNYTSIYVDNSLAGSNILKFGNVIQYTTNSSQVQAAYYEDESESIVRAILWCDFNSTPMQKLWNKTSIQQNSPKITTVYGTVLSVDKSKVRIHIPDNENGYETDVFINDTQKVVKINREEKSLDIGTFYDIQPGRKIFVRMRYDKIKDVVIQG